MNAGQVTVRQAEVAMAVQKHGSLAGAARELGVSQPAVSQTYAAYLRNSGRPVPRRLSAGEIARRMAEAEERVRVLEAQARVVVPTVELLDETIGKLQAVVARLEGLQIAPAPVSHRRVADGGQRVRHQHRRARPAA